MAIKPATNIAKRKPLTTATFLITTPSLYNVVMITTQQHQPFTCQSATLIIYGLFNSPDLYSLPPCFLVYNTEKPDLMDKEDNWAYKKYGNYPAIKRGFLSE